MLERFGGRGEGELLDAVRAPCFLRIVEVGERIPVGDLDAAMAGDARPVEAVPERLPADSRGCDDAVAGDGDAPPGAFHDGIKLPTTRS